MATRPGNGQQTAPEQGMRLAAATLVIAILGLLLGVLFPPLFLLGVVAIALGAGNLGGQERLSSAGRGLTIAGLVVGVIGLLMTVPFLMDSID
jgi:1,4-dihydroxy-2-naphthoate octaprenyltransferase